MTPTPAQLALAKEDAERFRKEHACEPGDYSLLVLADALAASESECAALRARAERAERVVKAAEAEQKGVGCSLILDEALAAWRKEKP